MSALSSSITDRRAFARRRKEAAEERRAVERRRDNRARREAEDELLRRLEEMPSDRWGEFRVIWMRYLFPRVKQDARDRIWERCADEVEPLAVRRKALAIWWTSDEEIRAADALGGLDGKPIRCGNVWWPLYLIEEYCERRERVADGRLSVHEVVRDARTVCLDLDRLAALGDLGVRDGIAIRRRDIPLVARYGGVVTDLHLRAVTGVAPILQVVAR